MTPNDRDAHRELPRPLRRAVLHVRRTAPPAAAQTRALERARQLPRRRRRTRRDLLAVAGIAAALLVGFLFWGERPAEVAASRLEQRVATSDGFENSIESYAPVRRILVRGPSRTRADGRFPDLTETDLGNPERKGSTNYDVERIELESVPGPVGVPEDHRKQYRETVILNGSQIVKERYDATRTVTVCKSVQGPDGRWRIVQEVRNATVTECTAADAIAKAVEKEGPRRPPMLSKIPLPQGTDLDNAKKEKAEQLARTWGELPGKERAEELQKLMSDLPPEHRKLVREYFGRLEDVRLKEQASEKGPAVWHRDAAQPTVARVYVGDRNSLELVSIQVTVVIEGPRARTLVDHVFRNPHDRQLEGTFEYPLPTGASPSYFAMFLGQTRDTPPPRFARRGEAPPLPADALAKLQPEELVKQVNTTDWGLLQVARVVPPDDGKEAYEETTRRRIDPALLEYAGGNTFRGRVFPIPPKGYNRVLIAYEETLPLSGGRQVYRYPLPGVAVQEMNFTLQASAAECLQPTFDLGTGSKSERDGRLTFVRSWQQEKPAGDVVFSSVPPRPDVQALSGWQGDGTALYVSARLRPHLPAERKWPFAEHAVFLLDTSASERPDRFAVSMKLLKAILENDPDIKSFDVLTFGVGAAWLTPQGWLPNTPEGRKTALDRLDGLLLEGATDLGAALDKLARVKLPAATPVNCFLLSDGHLTWGETDAPTLGARFERQCGLNCRFHCYRTGLGAENAELFDALTRKGGGVFQCYGEADVAAAAQAHRHECFNVESVRFVGGPPASDVLVAGRKAAVYPGGELLVAARLEHVGRTTVVVEGTFRGAKVTHEFPVEAKGEGELAARGWAEIAVASLLALNDPKCDGLATAYCQKFGIGSRVASFLVLETEAEYTRFNLDEQRQVLAGDLGRALDRKWADLGQNTTAREEFDRFLTRIEPRLKLQTWWRPRGHVRTLLDVLSDEEYEFATSALDGSLPLRKGISSGYLTAVAEDRRTVDAYLAEAQRRLDSGDLAGAVRVLSTVIEEHPGRSDALRLVGYRLLDMKRPAEAARLFRQVQRQRPFEPHSYRDLARSLQDSEKYGLAAVNYEIVLAGTWHNRFREDLKTVVREEYASMMQDAIRSGKVKGKLADRFGERLEAMKDPSPAGDLRVSISWNTDSTDVDLWVIEPGPDGEKCFYSHNRTKLGGELSQDQTQGYGPERYRLARAPKGEFVVAVDYYRVNPNLLGGETHVQAVITRFAGTPRETTERRTVILTQEKRQVEVCRVKF